MAKTKGKGGAPLGSSNAMKFKTTEQRAELFNAILEHLSNAWDQASFEMCDWDTVERYIRDFPEDFPIDEINKSKRKGHKVIESLLRGIAQGKIQGNAPTAIFLAKNKIKYRDQVDTRVDGSISVKHSVGRIIDEIRRENSGTKEPTEESGVEA